MPKSEDYQPRPTIHKMLKSKEYQPRPASATWQGRHTKCPKVRTISPDPRRPPVKDNTQKVCRPVDFGQWVPVDSPSDRQIRPSATLANWAQNAAVINFQ
jgi:hypothetical protein